jgi:hypothetical protein
MSETETLEGTAEEGQRLAEAANGAGLPLLLVGGVAVWVRCPSARRGALARSYGDADFVGRASDRKAITAFMTDQGYEPDKMFNAIHGATRLNYHDPARDRPIDVLLDKFVMAHALDLRDAVRSAGAGVGDARLTLPLADLLLTKLQVVSLNHKDLVDISALLLDHGLGEGEGEGEGQGQDQGEGGAGEAISMPRILAVTRSDWGFEHTIHRTLTTLRERIGEFELAADAAATIVAHADELDAALNAASKSMAWKMRARVGERVKWYEEPEEAR